MNNILTNLMKSSVAIAISPITVLADIVTLPASAYYDQSPFGKTEECINGKESI